MQVADRADLTEPEAKTITEYLQLNYLNNIPTILPEKTMRFLKRHLWRMDFGESDLYFDWVLEKAWPQVRRAGDENLMRHQAGFKNRARPDLPIAEIVRNYGPPLYRDSLVSVWKLR